MTTLHQQNDEFRDRQLLQEQERLTHKLAIELSNGQGKLLEMIAHGVPLKETLASLMLLIESQSEGVTCSTVLLDETGLLIRPGAAPHLPEEYTRKLDGLPIGPAAGSCGTAMYLKQQVIVTNMMTDPLWDSYRHLVAPYGYLACWSTPIYLKTNEVLGAFAMYCRQERSPDERDMALIEFATHIAGIAIERTRRETELNQYRENLEELIEKRTAELTEANQQAEAVNHALSTVNRELASALDNLRRTQEELIQKEKLASLGELVAGIAHELNTPIGNCITMITTLAEKSHQLSENYKTGLRRSDLEMFITDTVHSSDILVRNLNRAAELVTSFKQVAIDQTSSMRRRFAVDDYLAELLTAIRPSLKHSYLINQKIQPGLVVDSYPGAFSQVITHLVSNAVLHGFDGRDGGVISITAHGIDSDSVELVFSDDGNGIGTESQHFIFDPFYTTKRNLGGIGLGLHVVHNIVTGLLGGHIRMQSRLGIGTTFYLTLPRIAPQDKKTPESKELL
jgi:signal transduction histidine kinase